jgi:hypothetical protein
VRGVGVAYAVMPAQGRDRGNVVGDGAKTRVSLYLWQRAFEWWTTGLCRIAPAEDMIASWRQMPGLGHQRTRPVPFE